MWINADCFIWEYANRDIYLYLSIYLDIHTDDIDAMNIDLNIDIGISQVKNINKFEAGTDKFIKTSFTSSVLYYLPVIA